MKKSKKGLKLRQHIKNFFTKNIAIKIVSFLFAMLLWGYVLTAQNPARTKTLSEIPIVYEGEADLLARSLVISTPDEEITNAVSLQVDTELTKYADLSSANITAVVNMKSITSPGTYTIPITVTTTEGTVRRTSISPATVKIKIDKLITKEVPVVAQVSGTLGATYWNDTPTLSKKMVSVSGPEEYVSTIKKAICDIDLTGRTESFDEAVELVLVQSDGSVVSKSSLTGTVPTASVSVQILRKATLDVDVASAVIGIDELPTNYEMTKAEAVPAQITVVGSEDAIKSLTSLKLLPINVAGAKESITQTMTLTLPEGVRSLEGNEITAYVTIAEKQEEINYPAKSIEIRGIGAGLRASVNPVSTAVTISGRRTLMNGIDAESFSLYVDLTDLAAGEYKCPVIVEFKNKEYAELTASLDAATVNVTIREN